MNHRIVIFGPAALAAVLLSGCHQAPGAMRPAAVTVASIRFFEQRLSERPGSFTTANALAARHLRRFRETGRYADVRQAAHVTRGGLREVETVSGRAQLAAALLVQHRFVEAAEHASVALRLDSAKAAANAAAFDTFIERGAYTDAQAALDRLDPRGFAFLVRRARVKAMRGDFAAAGRDLAHACRGIESDGVDAQALAWCYTDQAIMAAALGRQRQAGAYLRRALDASPEYARALKELAWMAYRNGQLRDAEMFYGRLLDLEREDEYDVHLALAQVAQAAGDTLRAREYEAAFEQLARKSGMERLYGHHLSTYLATQPGRETEALQLARADLAQRPTAESYEALSWTLLHTGRLDEALDAAERMIEGYPDGTGFYRAGVVHFAAGRIPEGRRLFKRALERRHELDPADERAIRRRLAAGG